METVKRLSKLFFGPNRIGIKRFLVDLYGRFQRDSLFQNSVYLMLSTAVMAGFGFVFWIIAARIYSPTDIGFATALISATILLSNFGMLGFSAALVRYLPKSDKRNNLINSSIIIVSTATILISGGYLLGIGHFAPAFRELTQNFSYGVLFVIFMVMVSVNTLTDSVFIAYRASKYNLIVYTYFGIVKVALPLLLVSYGRYGIFFAYTGSVVVSLLLSLYFMRKHFAYHFDWTLEKKASLEMGRFSLANYVATFMSGLPTLIMPTLIVNRLGASQSAYYYMASTIAGLLYVIPTATAQSLFAEGSHDEEQIGSFVKSASKLIAVLLIPAILVLVIFGKYILLIFGKTYSAHSMQLLQILAITGIFMSINLIGTSVMKVRHQIKELVLVNFGYLVATLLLTALLLPKGAIGAGLALMGGQIFVCIEFLLLLLLQKNRRSTTRLP
ncbi:MAG TPA: oligosaccharide flippase family protein [Bacillota bacterium]|nr:oligosaccharide flippase family protein [Bacillota bacterium]